MPKKSAHAPKHETIYQKLCTHQTLITSQTPFYSDNDGHDDCWDKTVDECHWSQDLVCDLPNTFNRADTQEHLCPQCECNIRLFRLIKINIGFYVDSWSIRRSIMNRWAHLSLDAWPHSILIWWHPFQCGTNLHALFHSNYNREPSNTFYFAPRLFSITQSRELSLQNREGCAQLF